MDRYKLECFYRGKWINLKHYTNLSKHKANFYLHLCSCMKQDQQFRCVPLWMKIGDTTQSVSKRGAFVWVPLYITKFLLIAERMISATTTPHQVLAQVLWNGTHSLNLASSTRWRTLTTLTAMSRVWRVQNQNWPPWKGLTKLVKAYIFVRCLRKFTF